MGEEAIVKIWAWYQIGGHWKCRVIADAKHPDCARCKVDDGLRPCDGGVLNFTAYYC